MATEKETRRVIRRINCKRITAVVKKLFIEANIVLEADVIAALRQSCEREESLTGKQVLEKIIENADIACKNKMPICQYTGLAIAFVELGQDVHVIGGDSVITHHEKRRDGEVCLNSVQNTFLAGGQAKRCADLS